jgi:phosphate butyryltransferase
MISNFDELIRLAKSKGKKRIAIAAADDEAVLIACKMAMDQGLIIPILIGNQNKIKKICAHIGMDISQFEIIPQDDPVACSRIAVRYIKEGKADLLMKGLVSTAPLLQAVLNKDSGIRKNPLLSHIALFQTSYYHKIIGVTDAAMNIAPCLEDKISIIKNAIEVFQKIGILKPKIAILCPIESVNEKIESTLHAAILSTMYKRGQIMNCVIDGPLALDNAISKEAAFHKGIQSDVSGEVDLLVTSDLNSGNVLYKSLIFMGGAKAAAVIVGASVPIVLTSRADSEESKLHSIALATILS